MYQETISNTSLALSEIGLDPRFATFFQNNESSNEKSSRKLTKLEKMLILLLIATLVPSVLTGCNLKEPLPSDTKETVVKPPFTILVEGTAKDPILRIQMNDEKGTCRILHLKPGEKPNEINKVSGDITHEGDCQSYREEGTSMRVVVEEVKGQLLFLLIRVDDDPNTPENEGEWEKAEEYLIDHSLLH